ncbi:hypothetical protein OAI89_03340 [Candidatus Pelagibacter sp.]|nr:hypothetical protein [Candidatus Pelagibacter sp.]
MKNVKKIGLSALAGSLVAFSANAVEMGVSGTAEVTYTTNGGNVANTNTGNAWGANNSISFSAEGDVGFGTAKIVRTLNDNVSANWLSAWQTLDLGSMGKLSFDAVGGGLEGTTAHDDILPTAYEEVWNGVAGTGVLGAASNDTIGYSNTFAGVTLSLARTDGGTAGSADGANDADGSTSNISDWHLKAAVPFVEGLTVAYGESTTDFALAAETDDTSNVGHILYSAGNLSVGYRGATMEDGTDGANATEVEAYAIAFNVNDELSVSVAQQDTEFDVPSGTNVTEDVDAINASYTMGAASVRATISDSNNDAGVTGAKDEHMELSLVLAF